MLQADETKVPWVSVAEVSFIRDMYDTISIPAHLIDRHTRYSAVSQLRRAIRWQDPHGVVHVTEVMRLRKNIDRITLCRAFRLNVHSPYMQYIEYLDIMPSEPGVTCLSCLGEM